MTHCYPGARLANRQHRINSGLLILSKNLKFASWNYIHDAKCHAVCHSWRICCHSTLLCSMYYHAEQLIRQPATVKYKLFLNCCYKLQWVLWVGSVCLPCPDQLLSTLSVVSCICTYHLLAEMLFRIHSIVALNTVQSIHFYVRQLYSQVLLGACISYDDSVCPSVHPSRPDPVRIQGQVR